MTALFDLPIDMPDTSELQRGASVAINGVCLTVEMDDDRVSFDVITETLERTNLPRQGASA